MAICKICGGEMKDGISCLSDPIVIGGIAYDPIRWGEERTRFIPPEECCDCKTPLGGVHHPGCCVERCPACFGQALGCPCFGEPCEYEPQRAPRCRSHLLRRAGWG